VRNRWTLLSALAIWPPCSGAVITALDSSGAGPVGLFFSEDLAGVIVSLMIFMDFVKK
jgi:hypothetical protein